MMLCDSVEIVREWAWLANPPIVVSSVCGDGH